MTGKPVRAGLVGSGPWAGQVHAPGLAEHHDVEFTHLWARNLAAARALASTYDLAICASHAELLDAVDLVSYSVPPAVQAPLAAAARAAGKAVLLEKPPAQSTADARVLEQAASPAASPAVVNYSRLLDPATQRQVAELEGKSWASARIVMANGALTDGGPFARSPWRHQADAALWDLGPHAFSLLVVMMGPVTAVTARMSGVVVHVAAEHASGSWSEVVCSLAAQDEESFEFTARSGTSFQLAPVSAPASAFRRALDVLLSGAAGVGDAAASDLRFSTHIVNVLTAAARSLCEGSRGLVDRV